MDWPLNYHLLLACAAAVVMLWRFWPTQCPNCQAIREYKQADQVLQNHLGKESLDASRLEFMNQFLGD